MKNFFELRESKLSEAVYDVSWGIGVEKQVVAKDSSEAIRKAKAEILKSKPKLADPKYSDTWKKNPSVHKIREAKVSEDEEINELSKKALGSYVKKASSDLANNAYKLGARDPLKTPGSWDRAFKRKTGIAKATDKLTKEQYEDDMPASPDEKSMAMRQAKFIEYVAEEVEEYLEQNRPFPEWMQNKLTALHEKAKDMHAVLAGDYEGEDDEEEIDEARKYTPPTKAEIEADKRKDQRGKPRPSMTPKSVTNKQYAGMRGGLKKEEVDLEEDISKMSHGRLKWHMNTGTPHGRYSNAEMKAERDRRMKYRDSADAYKKAKPGLSEESDLDEAAPKIKPDFIKTQREKDRAHDAAMGRTATGRKKPTRPMTSTQRSLAQIRNKTK